VKVEYSSNNSGGSWWLEDADWHALEAAGWEVEWYANRDSEFFGPDEGGRFLGALASSATRYGLSLRDAIEEWESITGERASALGCSCCGTPHSFSYEGDNGDYEYYSPSYPEYGYDYY
jgi:hypothetical protein